MRFVIAAFLLLLGSTIAWADPAALGGMVSSAAEGKMEGVLVSATKADNTKVRPEDKLHDPAIHEFALKTWMPGDEPGHDDKKERIGRNEDEF